MGDNLVPNGLSMVCKVRCSKSIYPRSLAGGQSSDTLDQVKHQTNGGGHTYNYYFAGSRSEDEDPLGDSHVAFFDPQGNPSRRIDQLGNEILSVYDGENRLILQTVPEGHQTALGYDNNHNIIRNSK